MAASRQYNSNTTSCCSINHLSNFFQMIRTYIAIAIASLMSTASAVALPDPLLTQHQLQHSTSKQHDGANSARGRVGGGISSKSAKLVEAGDEDSIVAKSNSHKHSIAKDSKQSGTRIVNPLAKEVAASKVDDGTLSKGGKRGINKEGGEKRENQLLRDPEKNREKPIKGVPDDEQVDDTQAVAAIDGQPDVLSLQNEKLRVSAAAFGVVSGGVIVVAFAGFMLYTSRPYRIYGEITLLVEEECDNLYDANPASHDSYGDV